MTHIAPAQTPAGIDIAVERRPAPEGTDAATLATVRMMCEYIQQGISDPLVQRCADYAFQKFGGGVDSPAAKAWAVFWYVKHCVKFQLDEATMFRVGDRDQQDLLVAPPVLVRMQKPAEDCDGFTMLCAALCSILGVDVVIAVVAASPGDPSRWSHVFPCAILPGGQVLPLDASHGVGPGWMVPPEHIFRWQAFTLEGDQADVRPMHFQGLHNYERVWNTPAAGRGVGSTWTDFFQDISKQGVDIVRSIVTPPAYKSTTRDASGNLLETTVRANSTAASAATAAGTSSTLMWAGLGLVGILAVVAMTRKGN